MLRVGLAFFVVAYADSTDYEEYTGKTCYNGHGGVEIDSDSTAPVGLSIPDCETRCDSDSQCDCVSYRPSDQKCWKRGSCVPEQFGSDGNYDTYVKTAGPSPTPPSPPTPTPTPTPGKYTEYSGKNCYGAQGGIEIDSDSSAPVGLSAEDCQARCDGDGACSCVTRRSSDGKCWKRSSCNPALFGSDSGFTVYYRPPTPSPPPSGSGCADAGWVNQYVGRNPLGIVPKAKRSDNYFLILGDWGKAGGPGPCQSQVASLMKAYVRSQAAAGKKCLLIAAVGDNFYWTGNSGDWSTQWGNVYGTAEPSSELYEIPFLAIMGNHDFGATDKYATCPAKGALATVGGNVYGSTQFNHDKNPARPSGTEKYYLPDYNYHYEIPEVGLELIGVDQSAVDIYGLGGGKSDAAQVWNNCGGQRYTQGFLDLTKASGEDLLRCRAKVGNASTVVITQHYPQSGKEVKSVFDGAVPAGRKVSSISAYGHAHDQKCDARNAAGQCDHILTGGGGGCCASDLPKNYAGFTAVHLNEDGSFTSDVESSAVRLPWGSCSWASAGELEERPGYEEEEVEV